MYVQIKKSGKSKNKTVIHSIRQKRASNIEGKKLNVVPNHDNSSGTVPCIYSHVTKRIIQMMDDQEGWVKKGKQTKSQPAVEQEIKSILRKNGWRERNGTYHFKLQSQVKVEHQIVNSHMTITKKDITAASKNNRQHFEDKVKIKNVTKALPYHITLEKGDEYKDSDNPRFFSNDSSWNNAGGVSNTDKTNLQNEAKGKMESIK